MRQIDIARKCRIGIEGYCGILSFLRTERTADQVAQHAGINQQTAHFLLRWMRHLGLIHRQSWYRPTKKSRMVAMWMLGREGDVPCPDRVEGGMPRKIPSGLMLLATAVDLLRDEPMTVKELSSELAMHEETGARLIRHLRDHKLSHIKSWIKPATGVTVAQHVYAAAGNDAKRPPRIPIKQQRAKHYATQVAKKKHLMLVHIMAGAANQPQAEQAA